MATDSSTPADRPHSPWRRPLRIAAGLFAAWILLLACITGVPVRLARIVGLLPPLKGHPFTISGDTTIVTAPLDADGWPDYNAYLNARNSAGVTPETNAVVALRAVLGLSLPPSRETTALDVALGFDPATSTIPALQSPANLLPHLSPEEQALLISDKVRDASRSACSTADSPDLAILIDQNSAALYALVEGSRRPHWYIPQLPDRDVPEHHYQPMSLSPLGISEVLYPLRLLTARAIRRDSQRPIRHAIDDLVAVARIGRKLSQDGLFISIVVGMSLDSTAVQGLTDVIMRAAVTEADLDYLAKEWDRLPPLATPADALESGERRFMTSQVVLVAFLVSRGMASDDPAWEDSLSFVKQMRYAAIDWDVALRRIQADFDDAARIARRESRSLRSAGLSRFGSRIEARAKQYQHWAGLGVGSFLRSATTNGEAVAALTMRELFNTFFFDSDFTHLARQRLLRLAIALRRVHLRTGRFPDSLDALPAEFAALSRLDPFTDADPFHYQVTPEGCLLYSVGPNGQSEQDDVTATPEGSSPDDIVVKLTVPPPDQSP